MSDNSAPPIPKRIVICCDGTWQSAVSGVENSPSNVTRLARMLQRAAFDEKAFEDSTSEEPSGEGYSEVTSIDNSKKRKIWQQIVWYDSGVGTTSSWLGKKAEGAFGWGLEGNIIEAYNFLVLNWNPGDQVMCVGFSRGAYTARSIAGLVSDIGICEPRELHNFHEIWDMYKKTKPGERFYGSDAYFEWLEGKPADEQPEDLGYKSMNFRWEKHPHGDWARTPESREIELVAVYDTVGALGMPSIRGLEFGPDKPGFHNVQLNRNIKRAFQALALDEHREAFSPTLWSLPEIQRATAQQIQNQKEIIAEAESAWYSMQTDPKIKGEKKTETLLALNKLRRRLIEMEDSLKEESDLRQVWFPGVHINIGGGSSDTLHNKGDLEEISNITFAWMLDQVRPYLGVIGQVFEQEEIQRQIHVAELNKQVEEYRRLAEKEKAIANESWSNWIKSSWNSVSSGKAFKKPDLPDLRRDDHGWGTGTIIESYTTMYLPNGSKPRTPGAYSKDEKHQTVGRTNEMVHPTVGYRMFRTKDNKEEKMKYKPLGDGMVTRQKNNGKWEYLINGITLPEYVIRPSQDYKYWPSFERLCLHEEDASKYLRALDKDNGILDQADEGFVGGDQGTPMQM